MQTGVKRLLAIDPGTHCGWALLDGKQIIGGVWNLSSRRHEGGGMRFVNLKRHLHAIGPVGLMVYEEVRRHLGVDAAHVYGGIIATIAAYCEELQIPYQAVPVGTIKKHATGKGNAGKLLMVDACKRKLGVIPQDDNEADARWLLDFTAKAHSIEYPFYP